MKSIGTVSKTIHLVTDEGLELGTFTLPVTIAAEPASAAKANLVVARQNGKPDLVRRIVASLTESLGVGAVES
jgi:hypothetical protein